MKTFDRAAWMREDRRRHPERFKEYEQRAKRKVKHEVMRAYGGCCDCCKESRLAFLTIDHRNNDGANHRRKLFGVRSIAGSRFYAWLRKNGYPQNLGLQVLCYNCNCGRRANNGVCPHKELP